jgi:hypothetical protein
VLGRTLKQRLIRTLAEPGFRIGLFQVKVPEWHDLARNGTVCGRPASERRAISRWLGRLVKSSSLAGEAHLVDEFMEPQCRSPRDSLVAQ